MSDEKVPPSAQQDGHAQGGITRAHNLSKERRAEIARMAAEARWGANTPRATHYGELKIGELTIACAVLEDETRVLTQQGFLEAIGRSGKPAKGRGSQVEKIAPFLALDNLKPFVDMELADSTKPIVFRVPGGSRAYGYKAELLPRVCEVYLRARDAGVLLKTQEKFATACEILVRALAQTGIVALIDEATGYQDDRARDALARILEKFIATDLRAWVRTFPAAYFRELCRLRNKPFRADMKMPAYFGHFTNDIVYSRLAPGVLEELRRKNPRREETGRRDAKHFQWLTEDAGHPALLQHLHMVVGLMRASDDYKTFITLLDRAAPVYRKMPLFAKILEAENA